MFRMFKHALLPCLDLTLAREVKLSAWLEGWLFSGTRICQSLLPPYMFNEPVSLSPFHVLISTSTCPNMLLYFFSLFFLKSYVPKSHLLYFWALKIPDSSFLLSSDLGLVVQCQVVEYVLWRGFWGELAVWI